MSIAAETIAESHRLINQARVMAEAPAAQTGQLGHTHPTSSPPPGADAFAPSTLESVGNRINRAIATGETVEVQAANNWAIAELDALRHYAGQGPETHEQFRFRVCSGYEGHTASYVARRELTSITTVRNLRLEDGRDAARGRKVK